MVKYGLNVADEISRLEGELTAKETKLDNCRIKLAAAWTALENAHTAYMTAAQAWINARETFLDEVDTWTLRERYFAYNDEYYPGLRIIIYERHGNPSQAPYHGREVAILSNPLINPLKSGIGTVLAPNPPSPQ